MKGILKRIVSVFMCTLMCLMCIVNLLNQNVDLASAVIDVIDGPNTTVSPLVSFPEVLSNRIVLDKTHIERIAELEDNNTIVYKNSDGSHTLYWFPQKIKYLDNNGKIVDKSNIISDVSRVDTVFKYSNSVNDIKIKYPASLNSLSGVTLEYDSQSVSMSPINQSNIGMNTFSSANKQGNDIIYEDVFGENTAIKYSTLFNGIKEDIILEEYTGINSFNFVVKTNGMVLEERNDRLCVVNPASDKTVFCFGEIIAYDSDENEKKGTLSFSEIKKNQTYNIHVSVSNDFLMDENTLYPVYIDPTLYVLEGSSSQIQDITLSKSPYTPDTIGIFGNASTITAGNANNIKLRSLMKFPGLYENDTFLKLYPEEITNVTLHLTTQFAEEGAAVDVYRFNEAWSENGTVGSELLWSGHYGAPIVDNFIQNSLNGEAADYNITSIVKSWRSYQLGDNDAANPEYGIMFKGNNENLSLVYASYYSCEPSNPAGLPYVSISYLPRIRISQTEISIKEGEVFSDLDCETNLALWPIEWSSSNTNVATVNGGVITGIKAGKSIITASFTEAGITFSTSVVVYVTIEDGTYSIKNLYSGKCIDVSGANQQAGTSVIHWGMSSATNPNQLWDVTYIGEGKYFIQSALNYDLGLHKSSNGNVCIESIEKPESIQSIYDDSQNNKSPDYIEKVERSIWSISYEITQSNKSYYTISCNGVSEELLKLEAPGNDSNRNIIAGDYDSTNPTHCYWNFVKRQSIPVTQISFSELPTINGYNAIVCGTNARAEVKPFPMDSSLSNVSWEITNQLTYLENGNSYIKIVSNAEYNQEATISASISTDIKCEAKIKLIPYEDGIYYFNNNYLDPKDNKQKAYRLRAPLAQIQEDRFMAVDKAASGVYVGELWSIEYAGGHKYKIMPRRDEDYALGLRSGEIRFVENEELINVDTNCQNNCGLLWEFVYSDNNNFKIKNIATNSFISLGEPKEDTSEVEVIFGNVDNKVIRFSLTQVEYPEYSLSINTSANVNANYSSLEYSNGIYWACANDTYLFSASPSGEGIDSNFNSDCFLFESSNDDVVHFSKDYNKTQVAFYNSGKIIISVKGALNQSATDSIEINVAPIKRGLETSLVNCYYSEPVKYSNVSASATTNNGQIKFKFEYVSEGYYKIKDVSTGSYLTAKEDISRATLETEIISNYQLWRISEYTNGIVISPKFYPEAYLTFTNNLLGFSDSDSQKIFWNTTEKRYTFVCQDFDFGDRMSGYVGATQALSNYNTTTTNLYSNISDDEMKSLVTNEEFVVIRTHGGSSGVQVKYADYGDTEGSFGLDDLSDLDADDLGAKVVILGACSCGAPVTGNNINFAQALRDHGVNFVIAFNQTIGTGYLNTFVEWFFGRMAEIEEQYGAPQSDEFLFKSLVLEIQEFGKKEYNSITKKYEYVHSDAEWWQKRVGESIVYYCSPEFQ